jgi:hypothetical protein
MASPVTQLPRIRRWTRVEYERLIALGVFRAGERLELLDGLLVVREPPGSRHAAAIRRVTAALRRALGDEWQIDSQPIALDDDSEPEPDISVVPYEPGAYVDAHPSRVALIVEISEGSCRIDREYKTGLYARAGVADYWTSPTASSRSTASPRPLRIHSKAGATAAYVRRRSSRRSSRWAPHSASPTSCPDAPARKVYAGPTKPT